MQNRFNRVWVIPISILVIVGLYYIPPIHSRLAWRLESLRNQIKYLVKPPEEAVFHPSQQQIAVAVTAMIQTLQGSLTPQAETPAPATQTPQPAGPTLPPTLTPTPLPATVNITGFKYVDQRNRWNYCGPANLSMALNYWGWTGDRDVIAKAVKPGVQDPKLDFIQQGRSDVNVMPYELVDFVNDQTKFRALSRLGGDIGLAKRLLAAGFPLIAEKGYYEKDYSGKVAWLGHYQFVTGYDDVSQQLIVQDTWNDGPNFHIPYDKFMSSEAWLAFDNIFIVVYPPERENEVMAALGSYADSQWAATHALSVAQDRIGKSSGMDAFFAWFAKGTSHVALQEYVDAATAYDQAFTIYDQLGKDDKQRPYRMMWYQTGPYWAYFYAGRYRDVVDLANVTLTETIAQPTLEESIYWRGKAEYMMGDTQSAVKDYREALRLHPNWPVAIQALQDLGIQP